MSGTAQNESGVEKRVVLSEQPLNLTQTYTQILIGV